MRATSRVGVAFAGIIGVNIVYKIERKIALNSTVTQMEIVAPRVADKAKAGQFIILRVDEDGERIPLTVAGTNKADGTVKIIFQIVGATTEKLNAKNAGEYIQDFVGPLGVETHIDGLKNVCVVGGGVGCAIAMPIAQALHDNGAHVTSIIGFRNKDLVILEEEFKACSNTLITMTDDGSYGRAGNVTVPLKELLEKAANKNSKEFDMIITIGPLIMMKYVVATAKPFGVPVTVSMNPIMIDGTGMCGGCRLTLNQGGKKVTEFACVDGPDFNGYEIDFDEAITRSGMYRSFERRAHEDTCELLKKGCK